MDEILKLEIFYIELTHIIAIVITLICLFIISAKAKKGPLLKAFTYLILLMLFWMVTKVLKTVSPNLSLRWMYVVLQYLAVSFVQPAFLEFAYIYMTGKPFNKSVRAALYIIPVFQIFIIVTNPYHYLFYSEFTFRTSTFGQLFYVHMAFEYLYLLIGILFCARRMSKQFRRRRATGFILGIAVLFPVVFNVLYITFNFKRFLAMLGVPFSFDATPIAFTLSLMLFVFFTYNNAFLDVAPLMQHQIVQKLSLPLLIYNDSNHRLDANKAAKDRGLDQLNDLQYNELVWTIEHKELFLNNGRSYRVIRKEVFEHRKRLHVYVFDDITPQIEVKMRLDEQNIRLQQQNQLLENQINILKETSDVAAHNYVARELHDVVGHSLVLALRLGEMAKILYPEDRAAAAAQINDAKQSMENGLAELKMSAMKNETFKLSGNTLKQELEAMILKVNHTNIEVKFYFRGAAIVLKEDLYMAILNIIKESLTNILKYAQATQAIISVRFEGNNVEMYVIDNGHGCKKLEKGNGLIGIEERVRSLNGEINYVYGNGDGFQTQVRMPVYE